MGIGPMQCAFHGTKSMSEPDGYSNRQIGPAGPT